MSDLTFLTYEQVFGEDKLDMIRKHGPLCGATDFAILLGCQTNYFKKYKTSDWWTKSAMDGSVSAIDRLGSKIFCDPDNSFVGARPVLPYHLIADKSLDSGVDFLGIKRVEYGEYPQNIANNYVSSKLEELYNCCNLRKTGKSYNIYFTHPYSWSPSNKSRLDSYPEYEYDGNRYIRVKYEASPNRQQLSNGSLSERGCYYWVEVKPIVWLVDEDRDLAVSDMILFAGVRYKKSESYDGRFENTDIKWFMDEYFAHDMMIDKNYDDKKVKKR